jgi:hypothetical protein
MVEKIFCAAKSEFSKDLFYDTGKPVRNRSDWKPL